MKLSEHFKIFRRGLRLLYEMSPVYTVSFLLEALVSAVTPYVPIFFSARLVDAIAAGRPAGTLALYAALTVGLTFLLNGLLAVITRSMNVSGEEAGYNSDWRYAEKAMDMAYKSVEDRDTALLRERIQKEAQTGHNIYHLRHFTAKLVRQVTQIAASAALTASFFGIGSIPGWMKLTLVGGVLLTVLAGTFLKAKEERLYLRLFEYAVDDNIRAEKLGAFIGEYSRGKDIRLYGMAEGLARRNLRLNRNYCRQVARTNIPASVLSSAGTVFDFALRGGVYMILLFAALRGGVTVGSIAQYVSCITLLIAALTGLVATVQMLLVNDTYLKRYFSFFDIPNDMYKGTLTVEKRDDNEYFVEFRDVSFKYPHTDAWALRHVNFKFKVGEKLAIVGMNGSGKTTFIKLLTRLYDPTEGEILLNGVDIRKYDYDEYMSLFSVVFQDFRLFAVSLGQNVAANTEFDRARVEDCLRRAGFGGRERAMPKGLDTPLYKDFDRDGVEISGGEAQKIALARALYKNAPFIVLDEPTAALDPVSEYEVYSGFNRIAGDRTAVYISHRLASCRFCDKIAVFDAGQIVQSGRHEDLIADHTGKYHALWTAQAQYYTA